LGKARHAIAFGGGRRQFAHGEPARRVADLALAFVQHRLRLGEEALGGIG
jgi:hypothetical protein